MATSRIAFFLWTLAGASVDVEASAVGAVAVEASATVTPFLRERSISSTNPEVLVAASSLPIQSKFFETPTVPLITGRFETFLVNTTAGVISPSWDLFLDFLVRDLWDFLAGGLLAKLSLTTGGAVAASAAAAAAALDPFMMLLIDLGLVIMLVSVLGTSQGFVSSLSV